MKNLLLFLTFFLYSISVMAEDYDRFEYQGFKCVVWSEKDSTAGIEGVVSEINNEVVNFPEKLVYNNKNYSLTSVWVNDHTKIKSVTIPNTVTSFSFVGCSGLTSIKLPEGLTGIGDSFKNCTSLKFIDIPESVNFIGGGAFLGCTSLTDIELPENLEYLGNCAFYGCTSLKSISIPHKITSVSEAAFAYCTNLSSIKLHDDVTKIERKAFEGCSALTSFEFPYRLTEIHEKAFKDCTSLTSIETFDLLNEIYDQAFSGCTGLTSIIILRSRISYLVTNAFENCPNIKQIKYRGEYPLYKGTDFDTGEMIGFFDQVVYDNAILYVPLSKYTEIKDDWGEDFKYIEPLEGFGGTIEVANTLKIFANEDVLIPVTIASNPEGAKFAGFQFDIQLPEGIVVADVKLDESLTGFTTAMQAKANNTTRLMAYSDGTASVDRPSFALNVKASKNIKEGKGEIRFFNVAGSTSYGSDINVSDASIEVQMLKAIESLNLTAEKNFINTREELTLTASYEPADLENPALEWELVPTDGEHYLEIVSQDGRELTVRGIGIGSEKVVVKSALDPSITAEMTIDVIDYVVVSAERRIIKQTETVAMSASWSAWGADSFPTDMVWSTSDAEVATVDNNGIVTGQNAGETEITATSASRPYITGSITVTVEPRIVGDANDSKFVNVADVVTIANNIVGYVVYKFCFVNADTDSNGTVNTADLTKTVDIILNADDYKPYAAARRMGQSVTDGDHLVTDDFNARDARELTIGVGLANTVDYVALQATMVVPEGMKVEKIVAGPRAEGHSLIYNVREDGTVKILLFSMNNETFAAGDGALFSIVATADADCNNIEFDEIVCSDKASREYSLGYTGGVNVGSSSVDGEAMAAGVTIKAVAGGVEVMNVAGMSLRVFNTVGSTVAAVTASSDRETIALAPGFYIVVAGERVAKVEVK